MSSHPDPEKHPPVRFTPDEYSHIPEVGKIFLHYNYRATGHYKGKYYYGCCIQKHGFIGPPEIPPVLKPDSRVTLKCLGCKNSVSYHKLTSNEFKDNDLGVQNSEELLKAIMKKYRLSRPNLTKSDFLFAGVSITTFFVLTKNPA